MPKKKVPKRSGALKFPDSAAEAIAAIHGLIDHPPTDPVECHMAHTLAIFALTHNAAGIAGNPDDLRELLRLEERMAGVRGGGRNAGEEFSRLIRDVSEFVSDAAPDRADPHPTFAAAREADPGSESVWKSLEMLADHALGKINGKRARSRSAASMRGDAWRQLADICCVVREPAWMALAKTTAADAKASEAERLGALELVANFAGTGGLDDETLALLDKMVAEAPSRDFLVDLMQLRIELGLSHQSQALMAVEAWDEDEDDPEE